MERTISDLMTRVDALLERVEHQPTETTMVELVAIRAALKGMLSVAQATTARAASRSAAPRLALSRKGRGGPQKTTPRRWR